jgi:hypothetical protein
MADRLRFQVHKHLLSDAGRTSAWLALSMPASEKPAQCKMRKLRHTRGSRYELDPLDMNDGQLYT